MKWITLADALSITGHKSTASLSRWVVRWNNANPQCLVRRRHGYVDASTLRNAIDRASNRYTPGQEQRAAMARELMKATGSLPRPRRQ